MRHLHLALSRRGWSMRSIARGGPSFWRCDGLTRTHTCCRRNLLQSLSWRQVFKCWKSHWYWSYPQSECVPPSLSLQELYGSLSNDSRMLRALKDLAPDLEKIVKSQYVSTSTSHFMTVKCIYSMFTLLYTFFHFLVQKKPNQQKRYSHSFLFCKCWFTHSVVGTETFSPCNWTENSNTTVQQWRGKTAKETAH